MTKKQAADKRQTVVFPAESLNKCRISSCSCFKRCIKRDRQFRQVHFGGYVPAVTSQSLPGNAC